MGTEIDVNGITEQKSVFSLADGPGTFLCEVWSPLQYSAWVLQISLIDKHFRDPPAIAPEQGTGLRTSRLQYGYS